MGACICLIERFLALQFKIEPFKHPLKADPAYRGEAQNYVLVDIGSDTPTICWSLGHAFTRTALPCREDLADAGSGGP